MNSSDVLFMGKNNGVVSWYRCGSPAFYLGSDWAGVTGDDPNDLQLAASIKRGGHTLPVLDDYKIIVMQQVYGRKWMNEILRLRDKGIIVLYEIDDYLHAVRKIEGHAAQRIYTKSHVEAHEKCMKVCDGLIVSTPYLSKVYRSMHEKIFVCKNAIEWARYKEFSPPERKKLHIGWAGGEGHQKSWPLWLPAIQKIMDNYDVMFISIGLPMANSVDAPGRTLSLPFVPIENVPAVLCNIDIAIAPAAEGKFFKAKSDLRFLEFGALGIPIVANRVVYPDIDDGVTGLHAETSDEAYLCLEDLIKFEGPRKDIGERVRSHVESERSMEVASTQWVNAFLEVAS